MQNVISGDGGAVAILMCVHRGADPLQFAAALRSMQQQTTVDVRIYLYADGPLSPAHEAVITQLRCDDGGNRLFRGERPAGLPHGLNTLIDAALTDPTITFLARMDADDLSLPHRIARQVTYFGSHPDVDVAGTWCIEFNEPGVPIFHKRLPTTHADLTRFMLYRSPFNHPTVMFRRTVLDGGFRYDPALPLMQDYDLWRRLVVAGYRIGNVPEYLLWFRVEDQFFTRRSGVTRAAREIRMRIDYARAIDQLKLRNYAKYMGLFAVRTAPVWLKRLSYKYLRTT